MEMLVLIIFVSVIVGIRVKVDSNREGLVGEEMASKHLQEMGINGKGDRE